MPVIDLLDRGELDLALGSYSDEGERFGFLPLLTDDLVLAMRRGHPALRDELTAEGVAALAYFAISSSPIDTGFLDEWLAARGLERHVAVWAPRLSMPRILAQSDLVVVLSRRIAQAFAATGEFAIRELPCAVPVTAHAMLWHRRLDNQPAHRWLRELVQSVGGLL